VRGQLLICWDPRVQTGLTYASNPAHRVANVQVDLCGSSATCIRVDMSSKFPTLHRVLSGAGVLGVIDQEEDSANGMFMLYLQQPATTVKTTPYTVSIIVLARACSNMRFAVPTFRLFRENVEDYISNVQLHGEEWLSSEPVTECIGLVQNEGTYPAKDLQWGEEFLSVRALVQKPLVFGASLTNKFADGRQLFPHHMPPPASSSTAWATVNTGALYTPFTFEGYYSAMFTGVRGSSRAKMQQYPSVASASPAVVTSIHGACLSGEDLTYCDVEGGVADVNNVPFLFHGPEQLLSTTHSVEMTFPAYSRNKFWWPRTMPITSLNTVPAALNAMRYDMFIRDGWGDNATQPANSIRLWHCAGPDVTFTRFRRTPIIYFLSS